MPTGILGLQYEAHGVGALGYSPCVAEPNCGFGPFEVHPQMVSRKRDDGALELFHNGDWLIVHNGTRKQLAVTPAIGGKPVAESLCALHNDGYPTRVVGLCGSVSASEFEHDAVAARMRAQQLPLTNPLITNLAE